MAELDNGLVGRIADHPDLEIRSSVVASFEVLAPWWPRRADGEVSYVVRMFNSKVPELEQAVAVNPDVAPDALVRVRAGLWVLRVARALTFLGVGMGTAFALSGAFLPEGMLGIATVFAASMALGVAASHPFHVLQRRRLERALKDARDLREVKLGGISADASPTAIGASGVSPAPVSGPFDALEQSLEQERAERVEDDVEVARAKGER